MRIDMTPVLNGEVSVLPFEFSYVYDGDSISDISFDKPIHVAGNIKNRSGYMLLTLDAEAEYRTGCARCLKALDRKVALHLEKNVAVRSALQNEENDDYIFIEDSKLDIDEAIEDLLILELPSKHLCRDDCRGLCIKCGKDLNEGDCGCITKEPDPRMAVFKKLLDDEKK